MKLFNIKFSTNSELNDFIFANDIHCSQNILVQVFSGIYEENKLLDITAYIKTILPNSNIIGTTTAGEIVEGKMDEEKIIISFSIFETTKIKSKLFQFDSDFNIDDISKELIFDDTKVLIIFSDGLTSNAEKLLKQITSLEQNLIIAGGRAGDLLKFEKTFIFDHLNYSENGCIIASLSGDDLIVNNDYLLNWNPIGKEMIVTNAKNNQLFDLDGIPINDLYRKYLGDNIADNLPASGLEFPLIIKKGNIEVARAPIAALDDDSLLFGGDINNGDKVKFSFGNIEYIKEKAFDSFDKLSQYPSQGIFVYSCSARKSLMGKELECELNILNKIAPSVGFFTYGEYYHSKDINELLNITTTILSLSESTQVENKDTEFIKNSNKNQNRILSALTNLVSVTMSELEEKTDKLLYTSQIVDQYKNAVDRSSIVSKTNASGMITYVNDQFCKISGYSREELIGQNHNIIRHQDIKDEVFKELWHTIKVNKDSWIGNIKNKRKDGTSYWVKTTINPILNSKGEIIEYIGIRYDITNIMQPKKLLMEDIGISSAPLLMIAKINNYDIIKEFYGESIINRIEELFEDEIIKHFDDECYFKKVYRLINGEYGFLKDFGNYNDELATQIEKKLKKFQENVRKSVISFGVAELDISVIISFALQKEFLFETVELGLKKAILDKEDIVFANDFSKKAQTKAKNNLKTINMIKTAIESKNIISYFQPIINNKTGEIEKYESLVRLIDEDNSVISPFYFLEVSKTASYYSQITNIVINNSFEILTKTDKGITINLSALDIENTDVRNKLINFVSTPEYKGRITFELLEDEAIKDFDTIKSFLSLSKAIGDVKIAIDDFGAGYSNFERLLDYQPDILKIDGSLIKNILEDEYSLHIVETIVIFAKKEGIKTVAEFVSTEAIYNKIIELDIDYSQGYYLGKPQII